MSKNKLGFKNIKKDLKQPSVEDFIENANSKEQFNSETFVNSVDHQTKVIKAVSNKKINQSEGLRISFFLNNDLASWIDSNLSGSRQSFINDCITEIIRKTEEEYKRTGSPKILS